MYKKQMVDVRTKHVLNLQNNGISIDEIVESAPGLSASFNDNPESFLEGILIYLLFTIFL